MRDNAGAYRGWSIVGTTWRKRRNLESVMSFIEIYSIDSSKLIHKHALSRTPRRRVNGQWFALIGRRKQVTSRDELKHGISIRMYTIGAVLLNKNNSLQFLMVIHSLFIALLKIASSKLVSLHLPSPVTLTLTTTASFRGREECLGFKLLLIIYIVLYEELLKIKS